MSEMKLNVFTLRLGNTVRTKNTHIKIHIGLSEMQYLLEEPFQDNLEGRPLSDEILAYLGFEKYAFGHKLNDFYLGITGKLEVGNKVTGITIAEDIKYVHQLQNVIMALTGKELIDQEPEMKYTQNLDT